MYKDLLFIWLLILLAREEFLKNCGTGATVAAPSTQSPLSLNSYQTKDCKSWEIWSCTLID